MDNTKATPKNITDFASLMEISVKLESIGKRLNLHIDQIGELDAEVKDIFRGHSKSSDFVKHISERLEIETELAEKIAVEVNKEIFGVLKSQMQAQNQNAGGYNTETNVSALEQAGRFEIVKDNHVEDSTKIATSNMPAGYTTPKTTVNVENIQADNLLKDSPVQVPKPAPKPISNATPMNTPRPTQTNNLPKVAPQPAPTNTVINKPTISPTFTIPNPVPPLAQFVPQNRPSVSTVPKKTNSVPTNLPITPEVKPTATVPAQKPISAPITQSVPVSTTLPLEVPIVQTVSQQAKPPIAPSITPNISPIQQTNKPYSADPYREPI